MRYRRLLAASAILAASAFGFADTKAELDGMYAKLNAAMKQKNTAAVMAMCTKDFSWVDPKGKKMSRAEMEQQLKMQFSFMKKVTAVTVKIEKVTVKGAETIARTQGIFEGDIQLTPDAKKLSKLKSSSITDDTWIKVGGKWMLKKVSAIKDNATIDGKPVGG